MEPCFIYINGYPGVGKLTVARYLSRLIPNSKVLDNHHLIDPVAMVYSRDMPEYQPLRAMVRRAILVSVASSESTKHITWICTDFQSSNELGKLTSMDYVNSAKTRGSRFISIVLNCGVEENIQRVASPDRGGDINGKITDTSLLRTIRDEFDIGRFGGDDELILDTTGKEARVTAAKIADFVTARLNTASNESIPVSEN